MSDEIVKLENGEWTYAHSDAFKHGQHGPKMYGSCGYVNWHLIDADLLTIYRKIEKRRKDNGNI